MIVVYYIDCAPIFFSFVCSFTSPFASPRSPVSRLACPESKSSKLYTAAGLCLPFVYLYYTLGIGLVSFYQGSHELRERVGRAEQAVTQWRPSHFL